MKQLLEAFWGGVVSAFNPWGPIHDRRRFRPLLRRTVADALAGDWTTLRGDWNRAEAKLRREGKIP